jgi:hypothetical protein
VRGILHAIRARLLAEPLPGGWGWRRGVAFGEGGKADFPSYISFKSYLSAYLAAVLGFSASVIFNFDLTMEAHMNVLANLRLELAFINAPR